MADLFGHQTGKDVDLVAGGGGDQQIGAVLERFALNVVARAVARHAAHVVDVHDVLGQFGVVVNGDDVMAFGGQLLGQGAGPTLPRPTITICIGYTLLWGGAKAAPVLRFHKKAERRYPLCGGHASGFRHFRVAFGRSGAPWLPRHYSKPQAKFKHFLNRFLAV